MDYALEYVVADSALYTAETLPELKGIYWITRVPETLSTAREAIQAAAPGLMASPEKMGTHRMELDYAGVKQRWVVVYSPEAYQRALKSIDRHCLKQSTADLKSFEALCRQDFACCADAKKALVAFEKSRPLTEVASYTMVEVPHYNGRGRPRQAQTPHSITYRIEGALACRLEQRTLRLQRQSCFILATNQLDAQALSDEELIQAYKDQQKVERGFRFLKDPLFLASSLYLKSPKRIMALLMVMTLCLLVYAALEYRLRQALKAQNQSFLNQRGQPVQNPTMRWIFQLFVGLHLLIIHPLQILVLNLKEHHRQVLQLLGPPYEPLYS
jgi:transposase